MASPMEWVAGNPAQLRLQHLILNLLVFLGLVTGLYFAVSDVVVGVDPIHQGFDALIIVLFGTLYWLTRFRGQFTVVAHLTTVIGLVFAGYNFVINSGIQGPGLMVVLVVFACVILLHSRRAALAYFFLGLLVSAVCFAVQRFRPEWIVHYANAEVEFWDIVLTYLFCLVLVFAVMRLVFAFFRGVLEQTQNAQNAATQSEKMASLGQIFAAMNHEIATPVGVLGSSLSVAEDWWVDGPDRLRRVVETMYQDQREAFWSLLSASRETGLRPAKQRRERRARLAAELAFLAADEAALWADELESLGLSWNPAWRPLWEPEGREALLFALKFLAFHSAQQHAILAQDTLRSLVTALGSYARQDAPATFLPTRVHDGLETVLTLYGVDRGEVEFVREFEECPPVKARADELIQVWTNLVKNALHAMGREGVLTVTLRSVESWVEVSISDTGPGVPEGLRERIFDPFFTTKERGHGTGLGLGIVKKLVVEHGGSIGVHDAPGGGARFVVRLPQLLESA